VNVTSDNVGPLIRAAMDLAALLRHRAGHGGAV